MKLYVVPVDLKEANGVVAAWHRHHQEARGCKFTIACVDDGGVVRGVCIVGRPVGRLAGNPRDVAEVTRVATDGTRHATSLLYAAAARAARSMGYRRIQTYTLPEEGGASLRGAGWVDEGEAGGGDWDRDGRPRDDDARPTTVKRRWACEFHAPRPDVALTFPAGVEASQDELELTWEATA